MPAPFPWVAMDSSVDALDHAAHRGISLIWYGDP
jgi:hypothetical protein